MFGSLFVLLPCFVMDCYPVLFTNDRQYINLNLLTGKKDIRADRMGRYSSRVCWFGEAGWEQTGAGGKEGKCLFLW